LCVCVRIADRARRIGAARSYARRQRGVHSSHGGRVSGVACGHRSRGNGPRHGCVLPGALCQCLRQNQRLDYACAHPVEGGGVSAGGARGASRVWSPTRDVWQRLAELSAGGDLEGSVGGVHPGYRPAVHGDPRASAGRHGAAILPPRIRGRGLMSGDSARSSTAMQRLAGAARSNVAAFLVLAALNLSISWRLLKIEYLNQFSSVEGYFIAIARYISGHWGDFSWYPLWHCGMAYQDTYVPLLHLVVAAAPPAAAPPPRRAGLFFPVIGVTYALGAPALYWMAVRLGGPRGAALLSAPCYGLFSPSALLMADVARDLGG